jgi:hypothetical protein
MNQQQEGYLSLILFVQPTQPGSILQDLCMGATAIGITGGLVIHAPRTANSSHRSHGLAVHGMQHL